MHLHGKHVTESNVSISNFLRGPKEVNENLPSEDGGGSLWIESCPRHQLLSTLGEGALGLLLSTGAQRPVPPSNLRSRRGGKESGSTTATEELCSL